MSDVTSVRLAAGNGYVARRSTELVFSPTDPEIVRAFDAAPAGRAVDAVTAHAEENEFEVGDFVVVDWSADVRIAVFGEIEVTSDHRSLPRLSAAGAGTWVERSIRRLDGDVTIGVAVDTVDDATDLRAGVVQAGGFALTCIPASSPDGPVEPVDQTAVAPAASAPAEAQSHPEPVDEAPPAIVEPSATADLPVPTNIAAADALAASVLDGPATTTSYAAAPDDVTIVPDDAIREQISSLVGDEQIDTPNASSRWRIVFPDGVREDVDRALVLGRKPTLRDGENEATTRLLALDCSQVSSRHLAVQADGDGVAVTDLGSSNGSFVLTTGDGQLVQLDPGVPHRVEVGMIVQIGTKRFFVEDAGAT